MFVMQLSRFFTVAGRLPVPPLVLEVQVDPVGALIQLSRNIKHNIVW